MTTVFHLFWLLQNYHHIQHQHQVSSPVQLPGTTWGTEVSDYGGNYSSDDGYGAIKVE